MAMEQEKIRQVMIDAREMCGFKPRSDLMDKRSLIRGGKGAMPRFRMLICTDVHLSGLAPH